MIDVEGAEVSVLESATALFAKHVVHHAVIEWQPRRFQVYNLDWKDGAARGAVIAQRALWECRRMTKKDGTTDTLDPLASWARCLPALIELFTINLGEDM